MERKVKLKAGQHEKRTAVYVKGKNKVKFKAGQHLVDRERAATHQAPTTHHPPIDHPVRGSGSVSAAVIGESDWTV